MDRLGWLRTTLENADLDLMREMLKVSAEELMGAEADSICGAGFREWRKPPDRSARPRNARGGNPQSGSSRAGTVELPCEIHADGLQDLVSAAKF